MDSIQATHPLQLVYLDYLTIKVTEDGKDVQMLIITEHFTIVWKTKMAHRTAKHVFEKENQRHKCNYDHKIWCTQLGMCDKVLLKRIAFKGKHKIRDHLEDTVYHVEGQP